ncbi:uncharacterized protein SPPG_03438 [Spizellomyces punctatus DAOM BR117]|uniref:Uncharacterized protein n=1 Tax=Spizellomyces punctatus (strain DAOM BR117) TaxID=645134 RepID=A0A0L0HKM1_SPIPD|nr:uncharacterized protein SPPG_03438 [Spizellomyces punctatus DAOM BR117]KND01642.1 hypothetical protein SPPG_03438 [Spizellomyces punctatus DAOM BR117]|eukprot:XP_016609681.1 hypothetical protein SPPG_03438 [Spizellomyces punctatus DAOM BR117]
MFTSKVIFEMSSLSRLLPPLLITALCLLHGAYAQYTPYLTVKQLNFTGVVGQQNQLLFQAMSDDYALKWENLKEVYGCRLRFVIAHQSFNTLIRQCPEEFGKIANDSDTFAIYPTLPFAGAYAISAQFTFLVPNMTLNVSMQPTESTLYVTVPSGNAAIPPPKSIDQRVTGVIPGPNDTLPDPWIYQDHAVQVPGPNDNIDPKSWVTNGTFRVVLSSPQSGSIKISYCRPFTAKYYVTNSTGHDIATSGFQKFHGQDALITLVRGDDFTRSQQLLGYRQGDGVKWQPVCSVNQDPPAFDRTSNTIGFGLYFFKGGQYNVFVQTKINGYIVTSSFPLKVSDEEQPGINGVPLSTKRLASQSNWLWSWVIAAIGLTIWES